MAFGWLSVICMSVGLTTFYLLCFISAFAVDYPVALLLLLDALFCSANNKSRSRRVKRLNFCTIWLGNVTIKWDWSRDWEVFGCRLKTTLRNFTKSTQSLEFSLKLSIVSYPFTKSNNVWIAKKYCKTDVSTHSDSFCRLLFVFNFLHFFVIFSSSFFL